MTFLITMQAARVDVSQPFTREANRLAFMYRTRDEPHVEVEVERYLQGWRPYVRVTIDGFRWDDVPLPESGDMRGAIERAWRNLYDLFAAAEFEAKERRRREISARIREVS